MKYIIYISLFLTATQAIAQQTFADKKYYLVDSLVLEDLPIPDRELLNRSLKKYHTAKHDTDKIDALSTICENMMHEDWGKYQYFQYDIIGKSLSANPNSQLKMKLFKSLAGALNNIGYLYKSKGDIKRGLAYYNKSLKLQKLVGDKVGVATALNNIGIIYKNQGDIVKALDYYHQCLKIQEEIGNKKGIGLSLNNIGFIYKNQNDYKKALEYYQKSLALHKEVGNQVGIAMSYNNIGMIYNDQGDQLKCLDYYQKSLAIQEEIGNKKGIAISLNNLAFIYTIRATALRENEGESDSVGILLDIAKDYHYKSLAIREELGLKQDIAYSLYNIGDNYYEKGAYARAKEYGEKGMILSKELGYPENIRNIASLLSRVYEKENNDKKALKMYKLYITMRDSMNNEASLIASAKQQAKYQYEKQKTLDDADHDKLLAIEHEEKEKQQILTIATATGLGLVVVFLIFVFNRLQVTKKQKLVIEEQKQEVEQQKGEVEAAHYELEEKNLEIMDSIVYAKRIQSAILPPEKVVKEYLSKSFILYKPKDIVAGDFYWVEQKEGKVLFAAADCTGHGVPGAMVSVVCNNALNRSVREHGLTDPGEILNKTREIVIQEFEKSDEEVKDGMDIALCSLEGNILQYAGAHNPLWIIRKGEIIETTADKQPIGKFDNPLPYSTHTFELQKGDSIYIFSDGLVDQFGGEKGKKFKSQAFRELLLSIQDKTMEEQKIVIDKTFETWKGNLEQIDDVCVMGVSI